MDARIAKAREVEAQQKTAAALAEIVPRLDRIEAEIEQIRLQGPGSLALTSLQAVEQQQAEVLEFLKRHLPAILTAEAGRNRK